VFDWWTQPAVEANGIGVSGLQARQTTLFAAWGVLEYNAPTQFGLSHSGRTKWPGLCLAGARPAPASCVGRELGDPIQCDWNMRIELKLILAAVCLLAVMSLVLALAPQPAEAEKRNPCAEAGNLTVNCGFDTFTDQPWNGKQLRVPQGWWFFILAGSPDFQQAEDTFWGRFYGRGVPGGGGGTGSGLSNQHRLGGGQL
jgi:hypothetical protein